MRLEIPVKVRRKQGKEDSDNNSFVRLACAVCEMETENCAEL